MKEDTPISGLGTPPQVFNTVIRLTVFIVGLAVLTFCLHFGSKCTTLWSEWRPTLSNERPRNVAVAHVQYFVETRGAGDILVQLKKKTRNAARVETTTHKQPGWSADPDIALL